jgi:hypothetical protein
MATAAERMRALRERRRGLRRLTIEVSDDDLRAIAKRGFTNDILSSARTKMVLVWSAEIIRGQNHDGEAC